MTAAVRIAVAGAAGKMGQALIEAVLADRESALAAAIDVAGSPAAGRDAGERCGRATGVLVGTDVDAAVRAADVLIDFTRPAGTLAHVAACAAAGVAAVIGTTGFDDAGKATLRAAGERIALVVAPNMSIGVNVVLRLIEVAARALDAGFDVEVIEAVRERSAGEG